MLLLATQLLGWQLALIIIIPIMFAVLLASNATLLFLFFRDRRKSGKPHILSTPKLQKRRDELLGELKDLSNKDKNNL